MTTHQELGQPLERRQADITRSLDAHVDCKAVFILERRVNEHQAELGVLKEMLSENHAKTDEVLAIVGLGRSFFKVLGWIGDMLKPIIIIGGAIAAVIAWFKTGNVK